MIQRLLPDTGLSAGARRTLSWRRFGARRWRALPVGLALLLGGCALPTPLPLNCNDRSNLCFRGNTVDVGETRSRYGLAGHRALLQRRSD